MNIGNLWLRNLSQLTICSCTAAIADFARQKAVNSCGGYCAVEPTSCPQSIAQINVKNTVQLDCSPLPSTGVIRKLLRQARRSRRPERPARQAQRATSTAPRIDQGNSRYDQGLSGRFVRKLACKRDVSGMFARVGCERIQPQVRQRVTQLAVAGVEQASVFGNRANFSLGALITGIVAARWGEGNTLLCVAMDLVSTASCRSRKNTNSEDLDHSPIVALGNSIYERSDTAPPVFRIQHTQPARLLRGVVISRDSDFAGGNVGCHQTG
jgi:hypothetical protein